MSINNLYIIKTNQKILWYNTRAMYKDIKDSIVQTSYELFKEQGYEQTTIMDICDKCGITKTTFYRYINSKEDLLAYFFDDVSAQATDLLIQFANADSTFDSICACFDIILNQATKFGPKLYSQLYIANLKENKGTFNTNNLFNDLVKTLIIKGQLSGEIQNQSNPDDLLETCVSLCFGSGIRWCLDEGQHDFRKEFLKTISIVLDVTK